MLINDLVGMKRHSYLGHKLKGLTFTQRAYCRRNKIQSCTKLSCDKFGLTIQPHILTINDGPTCIILRTRNICPFKTSKFLIVTRGSDVKLSRHIRTAHDNNIAA